MRFTKILLMIPILLLFCILEIDAAGTTMGIQLTNEVTLTYSNVNGALYTNTDNVSQTVLGVYGINATITAPETNTTSPGGSVTFHGHVTNLGNAGQIIYFTNFYSNYSAGASGWSNNFQNAGMNNASSITLAPYEGADFYLKVTAPLTAGLNHALTNFFGAKITNQGTLTTISNYTGLNSQSYGGWWRTQGKIALAIVGNIPIIIGNKTSFVSNSATYLALGGNNGELVPGSEITYAISFTNSGAAAAYNLALSDPINSDVLYVTNSLRYRENLKTTASNVYYFHSSISNITDADDAENAGVYNCNGRTNSNTVEFNFNAAIPAGGKGTLYFKVQLK